MFSLSAAAKRAGVSKATIHRNIKRGVLSAARQDDGSYRIDPAELHRVFPLAGDVAETAKPVPPVSGETLRNPSENGAEPVLHAELAGARQLIELLERQVADLRDDRDGWRRQAESAQRLLTHDREKSATTGRPWWKRLAG